MCNPTPIHPTAFPFTTPSPGPAKALLLLHPNSGAPHCALGRQCRGCWEQQWSQQPCELIQAPGEHGPSQRGTDPSALPSPLPLLPAATCLPHCKTGNQPELQQPASMQPYFHTSPLPKHFATLQLFSIKGFEFRKPHNACRKPLSPPPSNEEMPDPAPTHGCPQRAPTHPAQSCRVRQPRASPAHPSSQLLTGMSSALSPNLGPPQGRERTEIMWCMGPAGSGVLCVGRAAGCRLGTGGTAKTNWGTREHWDPSYGVAFRGGSCRAEGNAGILDPTVWELGWRGRN